MAGMMTIDIHYDDNARQLVAMQEQPADNQIGNVMIGYSTTALALMGFCMLADMICKRVTRAREMRMMGKYIKATMDSL
jgi:hypothetical protein